MKLHRPESLLLRGLHLLVLCGFALAQPLYDILGRTPEFFVARGSTGWDVVVVGVALATLPAALLLAVEALAGLVSHRLQSALHLLFVGALAALIALQALRRGGDLPGWPLVAAAAALGALAAVAYSRLSPVRTGVTVLTPAPLVFLSLFLLSSPIEELQLANPLEDGSRPAVESRTPVTVIVFDELPTTSLLDADGRIDEGRFPSFASLAADATWFPNATTVHAYTGSAVPAILTGEDPDAGALPLVADHPRNLFTYLAESHRMNVLEPVTQLCPASVCERRRPPFAERMESLASDLRIVYLHVTL
ncbi:MAG TPA: hypothetical protein VD704_13115, partial [Gaiellaceae bacterium]|nr:hypothetical protein [Gaiellaceae bacterium]